MNENEIKYGNYRRWLEENYDELTMECNEHGFWEDNPDFDFDDYAFERYKESLGV